MASALTDRLSRLVKTMRGQARITEDNVQDMPVAIHGGKFLVHYTVDTSGLVKDVWILTPEEAAKKPWPTRPEEAQAWGFDPIGQVWVKP